MFGNYKLYSYLCSYKQFDNNIIMITKEQFEELLDIELIEKDGKLVYDDDLNLFKRKYITELPDNLKVLGNLVLNQTGVTKLPKGLEVEKSLEISYTAIEELLEDTKFGGYLFANNMKKPFSFPKVVKVNGSFECKNTTIKHMPEELYINGSCYFSGSTFDKLPNMIEVGYDLHLYDTPITELPECIKEVYGELDISNTKVTKLNDNLVVYGHLVLDNTEIKELPEGFITGEHLFKNHKLSNCTDLHKKCASFSLFRGCNLGQYKPEEDYHIVSSYTSDRVYFEPNYKDAYLFENENGKYIKFYDIFGKIVEQRGNVYHIKRDKSGKITYLVTDGEGRWSHSYILEVAKADLIYEITKRGEDFYKDLTLDSELSFQDAILCFMIITGACLFRDKDFIGELLNENKKDSYAIKDIIELTKDAHGNEYFKDFFCKD